MPIEFSQVNCAFLYLGSKLICGNVKHGRGSISMERIKSQLPKINISWYMTLKNLYHASIWRRIRIREGIKI